MSALQGPAFATETSRQSSAQTIGNAAD